MKNYLLLGLVAVMIALGLGGGAAVAKEEATGIVKQRMDAMRELKKQRDLLYDMLYGKKYLSKKRLLLTLDGILANSGEHMLKLFPKGSKQPPSEAAENIWTEWELFTKAANTFKARAKAFKTAAEAHAPPQLLRKDLTNLRDACKACHNRFQE